MLERSSPNIAETATPCSPINEYVALKQRIKAQGLLEKQPAYYTSKLLVTMAMLVVGLLFLLVVNPFWLQLVNAIYLAVVMAQIGFLGHDAGHRQIFSSAGKNIIAGLMLGNLLVGMSMTWWVEKHNQHHSHPNQTDLDPDIDLPGISFSLEQAQSKRTFERFVMQHQTFFFFPLLLLVALDMQKSSLLFLLRQKVKNAWLEWTLLLVHLVLPASLLVYRLGLWQALVFILLNQAVLGFILGSAFAPNHKGMPLLAKKSPLSFLRRQVGTARNIKAGPLIDFWYGGLNYQIEHHLFPSMPRKNLKKAQVIVKAFCQEHAISYYETNVWQSYQEILRHLYQVSMAVRLREKGSR